MKFLSLSSSKTHHHHHRQDPADPSQSHPSSTPPPPLPSWPWPYCYQPRTLSFRGGNDPCYPSSATTAAIFKTFCNSAFIDPSDSASSSSPHFFTATSSDDSTLSADDDALSSSDAVESLIRCARSESRLFFDPTTPILTNAVSSESKAVLPSRNHSIGTCSDAAKAMDESERESEFESSGLWSEESVSLVSMESRDPCVDFRESMEEMVEAHGLSRWEGLQELLCCYLRVNHEDNHGYIFGAFVDLLLSRAASFGCLGAALDEGGSPSSPLSLYTSSTSASTSSLSMRGVSGLEVEESSASDSMPCSSSSSSTRVALVVGVKEDKLMMSCAAAATSSSSSSSRS